LHKVEVAQLVVLGPSLATIGSQEGDTLELGIGRDVLRALANVGIERRWHQSTTNPTVSAVEEVDADQRAAWEGELSLVGVPAISSGIDNGSG
jgi:hypothetical protein